MFHGWIILVVAHSVILLLLFMLIVFPFHSGQIKWLWKRISSGSLGIGVCKSSEGIRSHSKMRSIPVTPPSHTGALNSL